MEADSTVKDSIIDSPNSNYAEKNINENILVEVINSKVIDKIQSDDLSTNRSNLSNNSFYEKDLVDLLNVPVFKKIFPRSRYYKNSFFETNNWIGHIISLSSDSFQAKLIDKSKSDTYEIGTFEFKEIPPEDEKFVSLGAVFYWWIGYFNENGQIEKKSRIRFKRGQVLSNDEFDDVADEASDLYDAIEWD